MRRDPLDASMDAWEAEYARRGRLWGGVRLDRLTSKVLDEEPGLSNGGWLDAGCGDGKGLVPLVSRLSTSAPSPVGLDSSRSGLLHARRGLMGSDSAAHRRVLLVQGDVVRPPLAPGSFQGVRAVHLIGHLREKNRVAALRNLIGLLATGGRLLVSEFGSRDFRAGKGTEVEPGTFRRGTGVETHYFTQGELEELVAAAGGTLVWVNPEEFTVEYAGQRLFRQRFDLVVTRGTDD